MDSSRAGNLRSDRARLHGRSNDPLLLRSRPTSASLHRRDHFNNLRLGHRSSPRITPSTCPNDSALQGGPHRVLTFQAHGGTRWLGHAYRERPRSFAVAGLLHLNRKPQLSRTVTGVTSAMAYIPYVQGRAEEGSVREHGAWKFVA